MPGFVVVTDPARLDVAAIHGFLSEHAYWSRGIPRATLERAIANSLNFGGVVDGRLVAYARVITDRATFAYLCDVFVLAEFRGAKLARALMDAVVAHPDLQGLRRFMLATSDAHGLYAKYGFEPLHDARPFMQRHDPDVYARAGIDSET